MEPVQEVLLCKCGACAHWEILHKDGKNFIFCMTCEREFPITLTIHDVGQHEHAKHSVQEHLEWVALDNKRKKWIAHQEHSA